MTILLQAVLTEEDVATVRSGLERAPWVPGKRTAGAAARAVKSNDQADAQHAGVQALETFVREALEQHAVFEIAARVARFSRLIFSRYQPGMSYGPHTDDALMGAAGERLRSDLSFTVFLEAPEKYEGGELIVQSPLGAQSFKLNAGDAILYPAGSIHEVSPVTSGERLACVGWVQSAIPGATEREILFDLSLARRRVAAAGLVREDLLELDKSISNLLRLWARP